MDVLHAYLLAELVVNSFTNTLVPQWLTTFRTVESPIQVSPYELRAVEVEVLHLWPVLVVDLRA